VVHAQPVKPLSITAPQSISFPPGLASVFVHLLREPQARKTEQRFFPEGLTPYVGTGCIFWTEVNAMDHLTIGSWPSKRRSTSRRSGIMNAEAYSLNPPGVSPATGSMLRRTSPISSSSSAQRHWGFR
jgi:hypothetical protein